MKNNTDTRNSVNCVLSILGYVIGVWLFLERFEYAINNFNMPSSVLAENYQYLAKEGTNRVSNPDYEHNFPRI